MNRGKRMRRSMALLSIVGLASIGIDAQQQEFAKIKCVSGSINSSASLVNGVFTVEMNGHRALQNKEDSDYPMILRFDPETPLARAGETGETWELPDLGPPYIDVAQQGEFLWASRGSSPTKFVKFQIAGSQITQVDQIDLPASQLYFAGGLAASETLLWTVDPFFYQVKAVDSVTQQVVHTFPIPTSSMPFGIDIIGENLFVWIPLDRTILHMDATTGTVLNEISVSTDVPNVISGFSFFNGAFWISNPFLFKIYKLKTKTGELLSEINHSVPWSLGITQREKGYLGILDHFNGTISQVDSGDWLLIEPSFKLLAPDEEFEFQLSVARPTELEIGSTLIGKINDYDGLIPGYVAMDGESTLTITRSSEFGFSRSFNSSCKVID